MTSQESIPLSVRFKNAEEYISVQRWQKGSVESLDEAAKDDNHDDINRLEAVVEEQRKMMERLMEQQQKLNKLLESALASAD